jgi:hypothetical protein
MTDPASVCMSWRPCVAVGFEETDDTRLTQLAGVEGPRYFYVIGMYVGFLLDSAKPDWKRHVFDSDGLLTDEVRRACSP